jgi:acyl-CoA thioesterase FadM
MEITVRTTDLNYGGHLGNDRILALVHEARVAFLAAHGWSELDLAGRSLIMADAVIMFRGEAFAGDVLQIESAAAEVSRTGFRLCHRLRCVADDKNIALVETGLVGFDYDKRRVASWPDDVRSRLETLAVGDNT